MRSGSEGDRLAGRCLLVFQPRPGKGHGVITGGTGKFVGLTGEIDYTTTWYGSIREGMHQGSGTKHGKWTISSM